MITECRRRSHTQGALDCPTNSPCKSQEMYKEQCGGLAYHYDLISGAPRVLKCFWYLSTFGNSGEGAHLKQGA